MKILSPEEFAERVDFCRPLKPSPEEEKESMWPIPFEYGSNEKGTRISVSKAKFIAAELRAEIAEAEKRELFRAFKREEQRSADIGKQYSEMSNKWMDAMGEIAELKRKLRKRRVAGT